MFRSINEYLQRWLVRKNRKPLLLRGARQVGKTWAIRHLAKAGGLALVEINFELQPNLKEAFATPDPGTILKRLEAFGVPSPQPGRALLFFDEIQECAQAIVSLRYFHELMPGLAVIASGSLLEFAMDQEKFSWPVGRIESAWLHPMGFGEFLRAKGNVALAEGILVPPEKGCLEVALHAQAFRELREYLFCGGMPEAVLEMTQGGNLESVRRAHRSILQNYRQDFHKYAPRIKSDLAEKLFIKAPRLAGSRFKFNQIDPDRQARDIRPAVEALEKAGVIRRVVHTAGQGLPLAVDANPRISKLLFLDVGLMHASLNIDAEFVQASELLSIHRGAVAEQFVGQELLAGAPPDREPELWFWTREALNSQAEVDFLVPRGSEAVPIEVKAGASGTLKSLRLFLDSHKATTRGYRFYEGKPWHEDGRIWHLPLFAVGSI